MWGVFYVIYDCVYIKDKYYLSIFFGFCIFIVNVFGFEMLENIFFLIVILENIVIKLLLFTCIR